MHLGVMNPINQRLMRVINSMHISSFTSIIDARMLVNVTALGFAETLAIKSFSRFIKMVH